MKILPITAFGISPVVNFKGKAILDSKCKELFETNNAFRRTIEKLEKTESGTFNVIAGGSCQVWGETATDIIKVDNNGEPQIIGQKNFAYGCTEYFDN